MGLGVAVMYAAKYEACGFLAACQIRAFTLEIWDYSRTHVLPSYVYVILFYLVFAHLSSPPGISARPSQPESAVVTETLGA